MSDRVKAEAMELASQVLRLYRHAPHLPPTGVQWRMPPLLLRAGICSERDVRVLGFLRQWTYKWADCANYYERTIAPQWAIDGGYRRGRFYIRGDVRILSDPRAGISRLGTPTAGSLIVPPPNSAWWDLLEAELPIWRREIVRATEITVGDSRTAGEAASAAERTRSEHEAREVDRLEREARRLRGEA